MTDQPHQSRPVGAQHARLRLLITAGPTYEPIDAVRFLGNRSSGHLGLALAEEAVSRGFTTTLLLGPTALAIPQSSHLTTVRFQTVADLQGLLAEHWPHADVLIMAAAVSDFRVKGVYRGDSTSVGRASPALTPSDNQQGARSLGDKQGGQCPAYTPQKLSRKDGPLTLQLEPTPDLLAEAAATRRPNQHIIGFALEPAERLAASAREKLVRKGIDAIVANPLETMDSAMIDATLFLASGEPRRVAAPGKRVDKQTFAAWLLDQAMQLTSRRGATKPV